MEHDEKEQGQPDGTRDGAAPLNFLLCRRWATPGLGH